jgi:hypothetical protein
MVVAWLLIDIGREKMLLCGVELDVETLVTWLLIDIGIERVLPQKSWDTEGGLL